MHDTARQHRRRSGRRPPIHQLLHGILPHRRPLDSYTFHQENIRAERRRERRRQKFAYLIRGVIVLLIGLLIAIALARENGPHSSSVDQSNPFQGNVTVPPSGDLPHP
jgi:hypothetical protein